MTTRFPIAAITDEFSQDIGTAAHAMAQIGMTGAELRMVFGKNIIDLTDAEVDRAREITAELSNYMHNRGWISDDQWIKPKHERATDTW